VPDGARGHHVAGLAAQRADPDLEWMRGVLSASYLRNLNAQAMVLEPATCTVHLATASGVRAAALSSWHAIAGARLMAGDDLGQVPLATSGPLKAPWPHYTAQP
jgi:hypothetical protein